MQLQHAAAKKSSAKRTDGPTVMEKFLAARAQESLAVYKELNDHERQPIFERFKAQNTNKMTKLDRGIESAMTRSLFSQWYAKELWGEPSAQDIVNFVEQFGLGNS